MYTHLQQADQTGGKEHSKTAQRIYSKPVKCIVIVLGIERQENWHIVNLNCSPNETGVSMKPTENCNTIKSVLLQTKPNCSNHCNNKFWCTCTS
jgi:hypothetical protein